MPSDYMRQMYSISQPMEITDMKLRVMTIPFLDDTAERNIRLGGNARKVFNL